MRPAVGLLLVIAFLVLSSVAQSNKESEITFTSSTNLVLVPTIVTDSKGDAINGMKAEDFRVLEDGKERKLASFEEVTTSPTVVEVGKTAPQEFTNELDSAKNSRITIILLDMLNTGFSEQARVRRETLQFLSERLEPGEPIALLSLGSEGIHVLHDFTTDPRELAVALEKLHPRRSVSEMLAQERPLSTVPMESNQNVKLIMENLRSWENVFTRESDEFEPKFGSTESLWGIGPRVISQAFRNQQEFQKKSAFELTLRTLRVIANAFSGIPGRKSLIWASAGIPDVALMPNSTQVFRADYLLYESTWAALSDSNIAVYPLDLSSLTTERYTNPAFQHPIGPMRTLATPISNLEEFSKRTGGRLCIAKMDMENCFRTAAQDASHYYQLTYYADSKGKDGWRRISVSVNRPAVAVHSRNGYFYHRNPKSDPSRVVDMRIATASPLDSSVIPLRLHWLQQTKKDGKAKVGFDISFPGSSATIDTANKNRVELSIIGLVKSPDGKLANSFEQQLSGELTPETVQMIQQRGISQMGSFELPAGKYAVRFVVRDSQSGRIGTLTAPLEVTINETAKTGQ
jgi:VWFA-related protein